MMAAWAFFMLFATPAFSARVMVHHAKVSAKQNATDDAKQNATDAAKQNATDAAKQNATDDAKQNATDAAKQNATDDAKQNATDDAKQNATGDAKQNATGAVDTEEAVKKPTWHLDMQGVNCFMPNFSPIHSIHIQELVEGEGSLTKPLQIAALAAVRHMTILAAKRNCHLCDVSLWGNDKNTHGWADWTATCASGRLGKGTGDKGACFSNIVLGDARKSVETTPMPGLPKEDCRQCPSECAECEPETTGIIGKKMVKFKCMLKETFPSANNMNNPVAGYICAKVTMRASKKGHYKTRCKFPEFSKGVKGSPKDYRPFWLKAEKMNRKSESVTLDLGVVDCIGPAPVKLKLGGHMKDWDEAHARSAHSLWKIAASRNVDRCKLTLVFKNGVFSGGSVSDAVKEEGKGACSGRNGPLLGLSCLQGDRACCAPCPHECKSCSTHGGRATSFKCKLKTTSPPFTGKLGWLISGDHLDAPSTPRGFQCSNPVNFETSCSLLPHSNYPVLPQAPEESTIPEAVNSELASLDNKRSQIVMGLYDAAALPAGSFDDFASRLLNKGIMA